MLGWGERRVGMDAPMYPMVDSNTDRELNGPVDGREGGDVVLCG